MQNKLRFFTIVLLLFTHILNAQNIDLSTLPSVEDITVTIANIDADTVIIGMHGGPTPMLEPGNFTPLGSIPTFSVVEVMQYQHINPNIFGDSEMTLEEAIAYNDTTVAMVKKVVDHYNNLDKTVVLMGISFGAFILTEYLDDYGIDDLHRIIPIVGRLDMPTVIWENFANGYGAGFLEDGITPIVSPVQAPPSEWALFKLLAGYGYNRYTDSLANMDLTRMMMVYGEFDDAVGRLSDDEIAFLENANAHVVGAPLGHSDEEWASYFPDLVDFIREDLTVGIFSNTPRSIAFKVYPTIVENDVTIEVEKQGNLTIADLNGRIVFQQEYFGRRQHLDLDLPKGFYVVTYYTKENERASKQLIFR